MYRIRFRARIVLLALMTLVSCNARDQQQAQQKTQSTIVSAAVQAKLATVDADAATQVQVSVAGGTATLRGKAHSAQERAEYARAASQVSGVTSVVNRLSVDPAMRGPREQLADAALAAKVSANIAAQTGINVTKVKPSVRSGVVTLSGTVSSAALKATMLAATRNTSGVRSVVDRLVVQP